MQKGAWLVLLTVTLSGCVHPMSLFDVGESLPAALLRSSNYPDLVVEVDVAHGVQPCPAALDAVMANLEAVANKRSIRMLGPTFIARGDGDYSNKELLALHATSSSTMEPRAGKFGSGETAVLHIVYLNGKADSRGGGHAAGRTFYDHGVLFVFKESFQGARAFGDVSRDATCDVERTVLLHELGHALGLVNRGIPMTSPREADDHAGHSSNRHSVMYPVLHISSNGLVLQELPRGFDAADLRDLRAYAAA
jgi:hypothetical protein